jgi:medium-chain acyl-[acyl-carrier-protein] hydrolase
LPSRERNCHQLPDDEFVRTLIQRYNGIPQAVLAEPELMKLFLLPILRADFTTDGTYAYVLEEPLQQPLTIFGGVEDRLVGGADLEAWKQTTIGPSELHIMPGGHFFIQTAQTLLLPLVARRLWILRYAEQEFQTICCSDSGSSPACLRIAIRACEGKRESSQ